MNVAESTKSVNFTTTTKRTKKRGLVPVFDQITYRPLSTMRPAPENDGVYKPVDTTTADFESFLALVRQNGIRIVRAELAGNLQELLSVRQLMVDYHEELFQLYRDLNDG